MTNIVAVQTPNPQQLLTVAIDRAQQDGSDDPDLLTARTLIIYDEMVQQFQDQALIWSTQQHLTVIEQLTAKATDGNSQVWQHHDEAAGFTKFEDFYAPRRRMNPRQLSEWLYAQNSILPLLPNATPEMREALEDASKRRALVPLLREILGDKLGGRPTNPDTVDLARKYLDDAKAVMGDDASEEEVAHTALRTIMEIAADPLAPHHEILGEVKNRLFVVSATITPRPITTPEGVTETRFDVTIANLPEKELEILIERTARFISFL